MNAPVTAPWLLPDGVEEWLPPGSWAQEELRRALLDLFRARGYGLILTPLLEHLDTLLTGAGSDLEQQTFKLVDPASGRLLGLRADMTPQAARIAARRYAGEPVVRLCYLGTVLRTQPDTPGGPRAPRQAGCELFGVAGLEGDLEVLDLALETLRVAGVRDVHLDLGHVGIYRALAGQLGFAADDEAALFDIVQRKSHPDLAALADARHVAPHIAAEISALMDLNGGPAVLARARGVLAQGGADCLAALSQLEQVVAELQRRAPALPLHLDLAELRGLRYHTGLVFAAFAPGRGRELARGGRYDGAGAARPATGFSVDVNELLRLGQGS